jgi:hypothetical protein
MKPVLRPAAAALLALGCCLSATVPAVAAPGEDGTAAIELTAFKAWIDSAHAGYGCDEGPARFRNKTLEAAYAGRHFYYVLTYTRGIQPPFEHSITLVAEVAGAQVRPIHPGSMEGYRIGLVKVSSAKDASLAAAAVMVLASCGERRWSYEPSAFKAKKSHGAWACTYAHGSPIYTSRVTFDKSGRLASLEVGAPPVP